MTTQTTHSAPQTDMPRPVRLILLVVFLATALLTASCQPQAPSQGQIEAAVAATLAARPTATLVPMPTSIPSPTSITLDGLFCEYGFCIGHPTEIHLVDASTIRNPAAPSTRSYGILLGFSSNLFIQMAWTTSGPSFDPQLTMRFLLEETEETQGNLEVQLVRNLNVYYQPIKTITEKLPYGGIAVWQCGDRDYIWKAYAPSDGMVPGLLSQALERFRCQ